MKKITAYILSFLFPAMCSAQSTLAGNTSDYSFSQNVRGSVVIPALQSMQVIYANDEQIRFTAKDMNNAKIIPAYCQVKVKSNIPWEVSVSVNGSMLESDKENVSLPVNMINLKNANSDIYIPLSNTPIIIGQSTTDSIESSFNVDLKLAAPGYKYQGGNYSVSLNFTLSPQ